MNGRQVLVSDVSPTITRHDDGHLTIAWGTSDGQMPVLPLMVDPVLLVEFVATHNEQRCIIDRALHQIGQAYVDGVEARLRLLHGPDSVEDQP